VTGRRKSAVWQTIEQAISEATGKSFRVESTHTLTGGCINDAVCLEGQGRRYFVKLNRANRRDMFEAEAAGLKALRATASVRVPEPITTGSDDARCWLVLEYIELGRPSPGTSELLGKQLADMHRSAGQCFGWERDNTIGATPQPNPATTDWVSFFGEHRLQFQLDLAQRNGADSGLIDSGARLRQDLPRFFDNYRPQPSLLHGDLWGGNWAADDSGQPVIFDPAVYYGDREADLAMTELFGGFDDRFYHSYRHAWAIDPGYTTRKVLYNLYHVLNHYNLFGGGYARQALDMVDALISEIS
jgi:protein-ribulosamine 3-kinase